MSITPKNLQKVFRIFRKNYAEIPLEIFKKPYEILVSTLMSARTKDEVTLIAAKRLFKKAPNFAKLKSLKGEDLEKLIHPVGFYKTKAKHLSMLSETIIKDFKNKVPETREELMKLPGVGRKTANLVLNRAFNKPAIAVDTHVHKISNLLGWVKSSSPEKTEDELNKIIPKKYWHEMNKLFVSVGRQTGSKNKLVEFLKKEKLII